METGISFSPAGSLFPVSSLRTSAICPSPSSSLPVKSGQLCSSFFCWVFHCWPANTRGTWVYGFWTKFSLQAAHCIGHHCSNSTIWKKSTDFEAVLWFIWNPNCSRWTRHKIWHIDSPRSHFSPANFFFTRTKTAHNRGAYAHSWEQPLSRTSLGPEREHGSQMSACHCRSQQCVAPQIRWRPLLWGLGLQFVLGVAVLRWKPGYSAIKFVAQELNKFLEYSFAGAGLVFGDPFFFLHPFAMMVCSLERFFIHFPNSSAQRICSQSEKCQDENPEATGEPSRRRRWNWKVLFTVVQISQKQEKNCRVKNNNQVLNLHSDLQTYPLSQRMRAWVGSKVPTAERYCPSWRQVIPMVIYIGSAMAICTHFGLTQTLMAKFGWLMSVTFGTTGVESASLIANIFLSVVRWPRFHLQSSSSFLKNEIYEEQHSFQTKRIKWMRSSLVRNRYWPCCSLQLDIAVLLEPFTPHMTKSEFHTMVVGCHASIAGFAYAIFVWFGVSSHHNPLAFPHWRSHLVKIDQENSARLRARVSLVQNSPQHLITAALMSAPAAVAIAKLNYPETEATKFRTEEDFWIKTKWESGTRAFPITSAQERFARSKSQILCRKERNVVEAAIKGAFQAAKASTALMVEILACYSLYVFANVTVGWFMSRVSISGDLEVAGPSPSLPRSPKRCIRWALRGAHWENKSWIRCRQSSGTRSCPSCTW